MDLWQAFLATCAPPIQVAILACPTCGGRLVVSKDGGPGQCLERGCGVHVSVSRLIRQAQKGVGA